MGSKEVVPAMEGGVPGPLSEARVSMYLFRYGSFSFVLLPSCSTTFLHAASRSNLFHMFFKTRFKTCFGSFVTFHFSFEKQFEQHLKTSSKTDLKLY